HIDRYGRTLPKPAHGSVRLESATNLGSQLQAAAAALFGRIADPKLTVRRLTLTANRVVRDEGIFQTDFFTAAARREKEKSLQEAMLGLDRKSTRLNSSHVSKSYAVFCLKTKREKAPT